MTLPPVETIGKNGKCAGYSNVKKYPPALEKPVATSKSIAKLTYPRS